MQEDGLGRANALALAHELGVAVGPVGFTLTLAGTIMSIGVALAARRGNAGSRHLMVAVIVAITAVAIFEVGRLSLAIDDPAARNPEPHINRTSRKRRTPSKWSGTRRRTPALMVDAEDPQAVLGTRHPVTIEYDQHVAF